MGKPKEIIKVDKSIKPIPVNQRIKFDLKIGEKYYISYGKNEAWGCILKEIHEKSNKVSIEVPILPKSKKGFLNIDGKISHDWYTGYNVYIDEIGRTPEEAVKNEVTM